MKLCILIFVFILSKDKVEIGDILDEINGNAITSNTKGQLRKIMKKSVGQPVCLYVIKVCILDIISYKLYKIILYN